MLWWCQVNYLKMSAWGRTKNPSSAFSSGATASGRAPRTRACSQRAAGQGGEGREHGLTRLCFLSSTLELGLIEKEASLVDAVRAVALAGGGSSLGAGPMGLGCERWDRAAGRLLRRLAPTRSLYEIPLGGKFCSGFGMC